LRGDLSLANETSPYDVPLQPRLSQAIIQYVFARLQLRGSFTDADLDNAVRAALTGLVQSAA
jgi:hypothetical protein